MEKQEYFCEKCELKSTVHYYKGEDVISVVHLIEDDHRSRSPDCNCPVTELIVINV